MVRLPRKPLFWFWSADICCLDKLTVATNLILPAILQKIVMKFSDNYQELTFFQSYDENGKHNIISTLQTSKVRILMILMNQLYIAKNYIFKNYV